MPFIRRNFTPIGGQSTRGSGPEASPGAPQFWSYRTQDAHAAVDSSGYFNEVAALLEIGDNIYVAVVNASGVLQTVGTHAVITKTAAGVVDVTNVTVGVVTNTD
jgi:predicted RNA-binding protein with EMAP domain